MKSTIGTNTWTFVFLPVASALKVCSCCLVFGTALSVPAAAWAAPTQQAYVKASNPGVTDFFGKAVAISGETMVVGAPQEDSNAAGVNGDQSNNNALDSGAAYVYVRNGGSWVQQAYLKASNPQAGDQFGYSVAVSGDTVVVGALFEASSATGANGDQSDNSAANSGAAYVFVRTGTNWSQQAYLKASRTAADDIFGIVVAVSGDTIAVGASGEDSNATGVNGTGTFSGSGYDGGAVYVFMRDGTNWSQQAYLKASNTSAFDRFGCSVGVSGDTIVVGAQGEDSSAWLVNGNQNDNSLVQSGAAYVFVRSGATWGQQAYLKSLHPTAGAQFGNSLSLSGDTVAVASIGVGAADVFVRSGTNWSHQAFFRGSNTEAYDGFGWSVGVSGDTVLVGAPREDSNTTGVNGNQREETGYEAGAAYLFVRNGTSWSQQAYLKGSNTQGGPERNNDGDNFGMAVAVSGGTAVVGARLEDSNATGVNGDQSNNSVSASGAAYVFTGAARGPRLTVVRDGSGGCFIRLTGAPDATYLLRRALSVTGAWDTIGTLTAPASGLLEYHDTAPPPGQAFYHTVQP